MLLGVFILQHSAMKRLQLKERLQVGTGEKNHPIQFLLLECQAWPPGKEPVRGINKHLPARPHQLLV